MQIDTVLYEICFNLTIYDFHFKDALDSNSLFHVKVKQLHLFGQRALGTRSGCKFYVQSLRTDVKCAISRAQGILKRNNTVFFIVTGCNQLVRMFISWLSGAETRRADEFLSKM